MSSKVKVYRTNAYFVKNKKKINFTFECRGTKIEDVLERVYNEIGSRHRVKRSEIFISKSNGIQEIKQEDASIQLFDDVDKPDFRLIIN
ncbi:MAG: 50S ribosomal protein L18Ae [Candidatus Kariarchaeaceae archaeon]|jgi:large subunit ribosomal protein LX